MPKKRTAIEEQQPPKTEEELAQEARLKSIEDAEKAIDRAYSTGKAERGKITETALRNAEDAVAKASAAMEADIAADEATKLAIIADDMGNRENAKLAREKERAARKKAKEEHRSATASAKQAYDAIKFSAPNKLGFLRVVMAGFAIHIILTMFMLVMTSRDRVVYNSANFIDWIMIILEGIAFWFFINRYKVARPFVIAISAFGIVAGAAYDLIMGVFSPFVTTLNVGFYIFLILYFIFSKRVKAVLVNDIKLHAGEYDKESFVIKRRGWPFIRNLCIYFVIFAVLGHWMEAGMCQFIRLGLVQGEYNPEDTVLWRDWLYHFPMEGAAVVFIALFLYPLKNWLAKKFESPVIPYVLSFLANALTCTLIELVMGLIMNSDHAMWDYSDHFCNFLGQVCLQNTLAFGAAASIITWFVYPALERWIARIPRDAMNIVFVVVMIFGGILWSLYIINPPEQLERVSETLSYNAASVKGGVERGTGDTEATLAILDGMTKVLQDNVTGATYLDASQQAAMQAQVDSINESIAEMRSILNAAKTAG